VDEKKDLIEQYQCPGCVFGSDTKCGKFKLGDSGECSSHVIGTLMSGAGHILLGLPKGFCRVGFDKEFKPWFYESVSEFKWDKFNVPVWKHKTKEGHVIVRTYMPRRNMGAIQIFRGGDFDSIKAINITKKDMESMD